MFLIITFDLYCIFFRYVRMLLQRGLSGWVCHPGGLQFWRTRHEPGSGSDPILQSSHPTGRNPHLGEMPSEDREKCHSCWKVNYFSTAATHRHTDTQTHRHTDRHTNTHTDIQTHIQTHRHTNNKHTNTHTHTDIQTQTQTHKHTQRHTHLFIYSYRRVSKHPSSQMIRTFRSFALQILLQFNPGHTDGRNISKAYSMGCQNWLFLLFTVYDVINVYKFFLVQSIIFALICRSIKPKVVLLSVLLGLGS